ncbi:MAG: hypothetical protein WBF83_12280, partial [Moheibacter sp.]
MDLNNIYPFSVWLVRNKSTCTEQELQDKVDEVSNSTVSTAILTKLWDNLFYQVAKQRSFPMKELIMQLLLANHVLNSPDDLA